MIGQRTRGLQGALLLCELLLVPVLLLAVRGGGVHLGDEAWRARLVAHYPMYALVVMVGLVLESVRSAGGWPRRSICCSATFWTSTASRCGRCATRWGRCWCYLGALFKDQFISRSFMLVYFSRRSTAGCC